MTIFSWKKNKIIDQHARIVADELYSHMQPDVATNFIKGADIHPPKNIKKQKKELEKIESIIQSTASQILDFKRSESLGVYGKARYHLKFMERLNDLGYPEDTTKKLNEIILFMSS